MICAKLCQKTSEFVTSNLNLKQEARVGLGPVTRVEESEDCVLDSVCVVKRIKLCFWATSLVLCWITLLRSSEQEDDKIT